jgi:hypothetical protein
MCRSGRAFSRGPFAASDVDSTHLVRLVLKMARDLRPVRSLYAARHPRGAPIGTRVPPPTRHARDRLKSSFFRRFRQRANLRMWVWGVNGSRREKSRRERAQPRGSGALRGSPRRDSRRTE